MAKEQTSYENRPERQGRKGVMTYVPHELARRLKMIAAEDGTTMQQIGEEALTEWIRHHDQQKENREAMDLINSTLASRVKLMMDQLNALSDHASTRIKVKDIINATMASDTTSTPKAESIPSEPAQGRNHPASGSSTKPVRSGRTKHL